MRQIIILLAGMLCTLSAAADSGVVVSDAWARATLPGQDSGSIQFSLRSKKEAHLIAIACPAAGEVEIHSMIHEDGRMKMRAVDKLAVSAGKVLELGKNGTHVMLQKLKHPLKAGESLPFTLTLQFADQHKTTIEASAEVRSTGGSHDKHEMSDMHDMKGM